MQSIVLVSNPSLNILNYGYKHKYNNEFEESILKDRMIYLLQCGNI
ncbi:hypothetical protein [Pedobacter cryophilus]|nr:hypothetical protein [Pedobacter cryophilus]